MESVTPRGDNLPAPVSDDLLEIALDYWKMGLNVLPCAPRSKRPDMRTWNRYKERRQTAKDVAKLFTGHKGNIGIITGPASGNLGVVDIEDPDLFEKWRDEFERHAGPPRLVSTSRGGHIYFRTARPINGRTFKADNFEIKGAKQMVMAPPSLHPNGGRYEFLGVTRAIAQIETLPFCELDYGETETDLGLLTQARETRHLPLAQCQAVFDRIATHRDRYASRSEFDQAVVQSLVNQGADFDSVLTAFVDTKYHTHFGSVASGGKARRAESYLLRGYNKAVSRSAASPASPGDSDAQQQARLLRTYLNQLPWPLKNCDKPVLLAHITKYETCLTQPWHLSMREAAEIGKVEHTTVSRCNARLIKEGYLRQTSTARWQQAASYALGQKLLDVLPTLTGKLLNVTNTHNEGDRGQRIKADKKEDIRSIDKAEDSIGQTDTHGVFERQGLGKASETVWLTVRDVALKQVEIVERTGLNKGTVSKCVRTLCDHGIVIQEGKTYRATPGFDFKSLAKTLDTAGIGRMRQALHQEERDKYQDDQQRTRRIHNDDYKRKFNEKQHEDWKRLFKSFKGVLGKKDDEYWAPRSPEQLHDDALDWLSSKHTTFAAWLKERMASRRTGPASPDEIVAWVAGCNSPSLRDMHDLVAAAATGTLPASMEAPGGGDAASFILHSVAEVKVLLLASPDQHSDADHLRFESLIGGLQDLRIQWKQDDQVDIDFDADTDPFADVEPIFNPVMEAKEAQIARIKEALKCGDPKCQCQRPNALVHCPVCERLTLWVGIGFNCEVAVGCSKLRRQRRKRCDDREIMAALSERGLWNQALTDATEAAQQHIGVGPKPKEDDAA